MDTLVFPPDLAPTTDLPVAEQFWFSSVDHPPLQDEKIDGQVLGPETS